MAAEEKISGAEIARRTGEMPGWTVGGEVLRKSFVFPDFVHAVQFVNRLAESAEEAQHHPDIDIRFNKVTVALSTHDAGGITEKDFELADAAEQSASAARAAA